MSVNVADAMAEQPAPVDEMQNLGVGRDRGARKERERPQDNIALAEIAERDLADDKWMDQNLASAEQLSQRLVARSQVIDPDRRIDQSHNAFVRRRRGALRSGSLPPRTAMRRALSRSINALSASRTRTDFSLSPVNPWAWAMSSSSSAIVVRIPTSNRSMNMDIK
jgi:hypothetical protein